MNLISLKKIGLLVLAVAAVFMLNSINNANQIVEPEKTVPISKTEKLALTPRKNPFKQQLSNDQLPPAKQLTISANSKLSGGEKQHTETSFSIKNNQLKSLNYQQSGLDSALSSIPINYHSIFHWEGGHDQELVEAYTSATQRSEFDERQNENKKRNSVNFEELISDFIYQHEYVEQIQIESLNCNNFSCVMYGIELQSGVWNMISEGVKGQHWAEFSQETTRSSVDENGKLIFLTIIKR